MQIIDFLLMAILLYTTIGLLFGLYFILLAGKRFDPHFRDSGPVFWMLIYPGCVLLWPIMVLRMLKKR